MKSLAEFAKVPELLEIVLDNEDIVAEYGEPITFYMKDFVDINTYFDFYRSQGTGDNAKLNEMLMKLILNKQGEQALAPGQALPVDLAVAALGKINENLGKSRTKSLMSENGNQPA